MCLVSTVESRVKGSHNTVNSTQAMHQRIGMNNEHSMKKTPYLVDGPGNHHGSCILMISL